VGSIALAAVRVQVRSVGSSKRVRISLRDFEARRKPIRPPSPAEIERRALDLHRLADGGMTGTPPLNA